MLDCSSTFGRYCNVNNVLKIKQNKNIKKIMYFNLIMYDVNRPPPLLFLFSVINCFLIFYSFL